MVTSFKQTSAFGPGVYRGHPFTKERLRSFVEGTNKAIAAGISIPLLKKHAHINASDDETEQFATKHGQGAGWITRLDIGDDGGLVWEAKDVPEDVAEAIKANTEKLTSPEFRNFYKSEKEGVYEGPIIRHIAFTPLPGNPHQGPIVETQGSSLSSLALEETQDSWQFHEAEKEPLPEEPVEIPPKETGTAVDQYSEDAWVLPYADFLTYLQEEATEQFAHRDPVDHAHASELLNVHSYVAGNQKQHGFIGQKHSNILSNLDKKKKNGVYDHEKAKKLFGYYAKSLSDHYAKHHGGLKANPATRAHVAAQLADEYHNPSQHTEVVKIPDSEAEQFTEKDYHKTLREHGFELTKKGIAGGGHIYSKGNVNVHVAKVGGRTRGWAFNHKNKLFTHGQDHDSLKKHLSGYQFDELTEVIEQPLPDINPDMPPKTPDRNKLAAIMAGLAQKNIVLPSDFDFANESALDILLGCINSAIKAENETKAEMAPPDPDNEPITEPSMPFSEKTNKAELVITFKDDTKVNKSQSQGGYIMQFTEEELSAMPPSVREKLDQEVAAQKKAREDAEAKAAQFAEEKQQQLNATAKEKAVAKVKSATIPPALKNELLKGYSADTIQFTEGTEAPTFTAQQVAEMYQKFIPKHLQFEIEDTLTSTPPVGKRQTGTDGNGNPVYAEDVSGEQYFESGDIPPGHVSAERANELINSSPVMRSQQRNRNKNFTVGASVAELNAQGPKELY